MLRPKAHVTDSCANSISNAIARRPLPLLRPPPKELQFKKII